jgi:hypothetical protein
MVMRLTAKSVAEFIPPKPRTITPNTMMRIPASAPDGDGAKAERGASRGRSCPCPNAANASNTIPCRRQKLRKETPMSTTDTVSPLRQRMIEDMAACKLNPHTQRRHIQSCKRFAAMAYSITSSAREHRRRCQQPVTGRHGLLVG